jgi:hypothetical protein
MDVLGVGLDLLRCSIEERQGPAFVGGLKLLPKSREKVVFYLFFLPKRPILMGVVSLGLKHPPALLSPPFIKMDSPRKNESP